MTPSGPRAGAGDAPGRHTVTEERLRAAFAARAALVTYRDLRREEPPRGRSRGTRRVRGFVLAGLGSVAAAAAAYALFLGPDGGAATPPPVLPARPPGVGVPSPEVPGPTPGPVGPSVARPRPSTPEGVPGARPEELPGLPLRPPVPAARP
ncbi:hypothetical protein [Streptomyces venezuelae]|uniref:hypothetical protein n=1 Tax=Streptomyces venezuelae TaxID=54571 RepID=UPI00363CFC06